MIGRQPIFPLLSIDRDGLKDSSNWSIVRATVCCSGLGTFFHTGTNCTRHMSLPGTSVIHPLLPTIILMKADYCHFIYLFLYFNQVIGQYCFHRPSLIIFTSSLTPTSKNFHHFSTNSRYARYYTF